MTEKLARLTELPTPELPTSNSQHNQFVFDSSVLTDVARYSIIDLFSVVFFDCRYLLHFKSTFCNLSITFSCAVHQTVWVMTGELNTSAAHTLFLDVRPFRCYAMIFSSRYQSINQSINHSALV